MIKQGYVLKKSSKDSNNCIEGFELNAKKKD